MDGHCLCPTVFPFLLGLGIKRERACTRVRAHAHTHVRVHTNTYGESKRGLGVNPFLFLCCSQSCQLEWAKTEAD